MTDPKNIGDVLDAAADLIEPEGAWTTGTPARDKDGNYVQAYSPRAVCWCAEGAVAAVMRKKWDALGFAELPIIRFLEERGVDWRFNDRQLRTQEEVVTALREAAQQWRKANA